MRLSMETVHLPDRLEAKLHHLFGRWRAALENEPAPHSMRMGELMDEPGLADARFSHDRDGLPMAFTGQRQHALQVLQLRLPPDESRQASGGRRLDTSPDRLSSEDLVDLHGLAQSLDGGAIVVLLAVKAAIDEVLDAPMKRLEEEHHHQRKGNGKER